MIPFGQNGYTVRGTPDLSLDSRPQNRPRHLTPTSPGLRRSLSRKSGMDSPYEGASDVWSKSHRENSGTLEMAPWLFNPERSPLNWDIPNKYPLYKVYMGLIIKGTIPRVPPFSP